MKKQKGFTLIELLVVISIIGFLASILLVSLNNARKKARDTKRLADMHQIQTALDLYYDNNNSTYPNPDPNDATHADPGGFFCGGWDVSSYNPFISALVTAGLISKTPADPLNTNNPSGGFDCGGYAYRYFYYPTAGSLGCDPSRGGFYVLVINWMESISKGATLPTSPGWVCPGNWSGGPIDFGSGWAWVTGKYAR